MQPYVHCQITYNNQFREVLMCPSTDKLIKKTWYVYTMEQCSAIKKKKKKS